MGKYWSVDDCGWVAWPPVNEYDVAETAEVPPPREAVEPEPLPLQN